MNTLHAERLADGRLRITIRSEGERDESVTVSDEELDAALDHADDHPDESDTLAGGA